MLRLSGVLTLGRTLTRPKLIDPASANSQGMNPELACLPSLPVSIGHRVGGK